MWEAWSKTMSKLPHLTSPPAPSSCTSGDRSHAWPTVKRIPAWSVSTKDASVMAGAASTGPIDGIPNPMT